MKLYSNLNNNFLKSIASIKYIQNIVKEKYGIVDIDDLLLIKSEINDIYKVILKNKLPYILKVYNREKL